MRVRLIGLAGLVAVAGVMLISGPASAGHPKDNTHECRTYVDHLAHHPDNGHGAPSTWAYDDITRKTTICEDGPAVLPPVDVKAMVKDSLIPVKFSHYHAKVEDTGSFITVAGAGSPNGVGGPIVNAVHGSLVGSFSAQFIAVDNFKDDDGTHGPTTGTWIAGFFNDHLLVKGSSTDHYTWTYTTKCDEKWIDAMNNNDGQGAQAGNITGKKCVSPSPSPSPTTSPSVTVSPTATVTVTTTTTTAPNPTPVDVTLPVTG